MIGANAVVETARPITMRSVPIGLSRNAFTDSTARPTPSSAGRSCASSRSPASVTETLRVVRFKSRTPSRSSSARMVWLKVEAAMPSWAAALPKLRCSATAAKAVSSANSVPRIVAPVTACVA